MLTNLHHHTPDLRGKPDVIPKPMTMQMSDMPIDLSQSISQVQRHSHSPRTHATSTTTLLRRFETLRTHRTLPAPYPAPYPAPSDPNPNQVNPRVQVEHTVTEEATGVDLVTSQLEKEMRDSWAWHSGDVPQPTCERD